MKKIVQIAGDSSPKKIFRKYYESNKTSLIIDFHDVKNKSDEYFIEDNIEGDQYEIYKLINKFLYCNLEFSLEDSIVCRVPQIFADSEITKRITMEDFGPTSLLEYGFDFDIYKKLIYWLSELNNLGKKDKLHHMIINRKFEHKAIKKELDDYIKFGTIYGLKPNINLVNTLLEEVKDIPLQPCHRDFQPLNILIREDSTNKITVGIIDNQDMCLGPMTYDLASLLYDYKMDIEEQDIDILLKLYSFYIREDYNKIQSWIKVCSIIRLMKSIGRHFKIYHETGREASFKRANMTNKKLLRLLSF